MGRSRRKTRDYINNFPANRKTPSADVLKLVFRYLTQPLHVRRSMLVCSLGRCMLVCKLWRDILYKDDYIATCLILRYCPAFCKPESSVTNLRRFLSMDLYEHPKRTSPRLSTDDLEFYLDVWSDIDQQQRLILSRAVPMSTLKSSGTGYYKGFKRAMLLEPRLTVRRFRSINVSLVVGRKGSDQFACLIRKSVSHNVEPRSDVAEASDNLCFSADYPFACPTRAWVGLGLVDNDDVEEDLVDVFRVKFGFCFVPASDENVNNPDRSRRMFFEQSEPSVSFPLDEDDGLNLLGMLDWK